jgi:hypothetical protein
MIIKFDKPISLEEVHKLYNNNVKFITSTKTYPAVEGIEFNIDPRYIFKRKLVSPKVTKKANKILKSYNTKIETLWNTAFQSMRESIRHLNKAEKVDITEEQKNTTFKIIDALKDGLQEEASNHFDEAYKLGKIRGQVLSDQEVDDELDDDDQENVDKKLEENEEYLVAFSKDLKADLDKLYLEGPFDSYEELNTLMTQKIEEPKKSRALMYGMAALGLLALGMITALKQADPKRGELKIQGGYWTIHPDEGKGGEVCPGCSENSGKWFTLAEFEKAYHNQDCLTHCRCDLDTL